MLSCKEVAERASALIDGELGLMDRLQLRLHLAMCKGCRAFIGQMKITDGLAKAAVARPVSDDDIDGEIKAILVLSDKQNRLQDPDHNHGD